MARNIYERYNAPVEKTYRVIDHTADIGIEWSASTLVDLFRKGGAAFCDLICDLERVKPVNKRLIEIHRKSPEEKMQAFLSELLFLFETTHELYSEIKVLELNESTLRVRINGEKIDPKRHKVKTGIKAVTYHQLKVWKKGDFWKARVIFDV